MQSISSELLRHFRPPAFPGSYFFSFEGIEGSGKSAQIVLCKTYLEEMGLRVLVLREPGGTSFGERLRQAILHGQTELHPLAEAYLFASSRAQLLHEVILKELETPGTAVVLDRYIDSTLAYQGKAHGLGTETVLQMHAQFPLCILPHRTFYLRVGLATSKARQKLRNSPKDYFESKGDAFHRLLIDGYDEAAQLFSSRIAIIDGEGDKETVAKAVQAEILKTMQRAP